MPIVSRKVQHLKWAIWMLLCWGCRQNILENERGMFILYIIQLSRLQEKHLKDLMPSRCLNSSQIKLFNNQQSQEVKQIKINKTNKKKKNLRNLIQIIVQLIQEAQKLKKSKSTFGTNTRSTKHSSLEMPQLEESSAVCFHTTLDSLLLGHPIHWSLFMTWSKVLLCLYDKLLYRLNQLIFNSLKILSLLSLHYFLMGLSQY